MDRFFYRSEFGHQGVVDLLPAGGIQQHDRIAFAPGLLERVRANLHWGFSLGGVNRHANLLSEKLQLAHGGRPLDVGRDQQRPLAIGAEEFREFGGGGGLAGTLQTGQQDDARLGAGELPGRRRPERGGQLLVDDFDHLLGGIERARDVAAHCAGAHARQEILDDGKMHIRLEQRQANLAQRGVDVRFAQGPVAGKPAEDFLQSVGEGFKHIASEKPPPADCRGTAEE